MTSQALRSGGKYVPSLLWSHLVPQGPKAALSCYIPEHISEGVHVFVSLYRIAQALVVGDQRVGRGAVEDVGHDVDCETIELVQGIVRLPVRKNVDQILSMPFSHGVVGSSYLARLEHISEQQDLADATEPT